MKRGKAKWATPKEETVLGAWQAQVAEAGKTPWLAKVLAERGGVLLPRFAACYTRLRGLPRGERRALQRKFKQTLARAALLLVLCGGPVQAATITVVGGGCTIVDAITAANTDTAIAFTTSN